MGKRELKPEIEIAIYGAAILVKAAQNMWRKRHHIPDNERGRAKLARALLRRENKRARAKASGNGEPDQAAELATRLRPPRR